MFLTYNPQNKKWSARADHKAKFYFQRSYFALDLTGPA